jgi:MIP family channel proteins
MPETEEAKKKNLIWAEKKPKPDNETTLRQMCAEALGTFGICYVGGLAVIQNDMGKIPLIGVAFAHTAVVSILVWATGGISGGHINGGVSLGFVCTGHIGWKKFWLYTVAQMLGSIFAGVFLRLYLWNEGYKSVDRWPSALGFPHYDNTSWKLWTLFFVEVLGVFFLFGVVLCTAVAKTKPKSDVYGICIGGTVGMFIMGIGPMTGGSLNPQRVIGPALISWELFEHSYRHAWIYYIGNYLGGALAGLFWYFAFVDWNDNEFPKKDIAEPEDHVQEEHEQVLPYPHNNKRKKMEITLKQEDFVRGIAQRFMKLTNGEDIHGMKGKIGMEGEGKMNMFGATTVVNGKDINTFEQIVDPAKGAK